MQIYYAKSMESNVILVEPGDTLEEIIALAKSQDVRAVEHRRFCCQFPCQEPQLYTQGQLKKELEEVS